MAVILVMIAIAMPQSASAACSHTATAENATYDWAGSNVKVGKCVAKLYCSKCKALLETVTLTVSSKSYIEPTCETEDEQIWKATGKSTKYPSITYYSESTTYTWGKKGHGTKGYNAVYSWTGNYMDAHCFMQLTCLDCRQMVCNIAANTVEKDPNGHKEPTCTLEGKETWVATFDIDMKGYVTYKSQNSKAFATPCNGHGNTLNYTPTYTWSTNASNPTCKLTLMCNDCHNNVLENYPMTVVEAEASRVEPGCEKAGQAVYNAKYTFNERVYGSRRYAAKSDRTYELAACGHGHTEGYTPTFSWTGNEIEPLCDFTLKCNDCSKVVVNAQKVTPALVDGSRVEPTCEDLGSIDFSVTGNYSTTKDASFKETNKHTFSIRRKGHGLKGYKADYTWAENYEDRACSLTVVCLACNKKVIDNKSLELVEDEEEHIDATCEEDGHAKFSVSGEFIEPGFSRAKYSGTSSKEYVILAFGHDIDENSQCTHCGTSFKDPEIFELNEDEVYEAVASHVVDGMIYNRSFNGGIWNTWYVPFETSVEKLAESYVKAAYIESVHNYDDDKDGTYDRTVLNVMTLSNGNIHAGTPYLVMADCNLDKIELGKTTMAAADDVKNIRMKSASHTFDIIGSYCGIDASEMTANTNFTLDEEGMMNVAEDALAPYRWAIKQTNGQIIADEANNVKALQILVIGEEDQETGIRTIYPANEQKTYNANGIFDLNGRKLDVARKGVNIVNGKKIVK